MNTTGGNFLATDPSANISERTEKVRAGPKHFPRWNKNPRWYKNSSSSLRNKRKRKEKERQGWPKTCASIIKMKVQPTFVLKISDLIIRMRMFKDWMKKEQRSNTQQRICFHPSRHLSSDTFLPSSPPKSSTNLELSKGFETRTESI